jgi:hypothetical protein
MTPEYKWLATQIVRCAERWPDKIGPKGPCNPEGTQWCLLSTIGSLHPDEYHKIRDEPTAMRLAERAFPLNDMGIPWGQIPKLLGLVPGELKEEATRECETVGVPDTGDGVLVELCASGGAEVLVHTAGI